MKNIFTQSIFLVLFLVLNQKGYSQKDLLQAGPMVGYSDFREVMIWVQTKKPAEVKIFYQNKDSAEDKHWTNKIFTDKNTAFTAHLLADTLEPGSYYNYELYINSEKINLDYEASFQTQKIWRWRTEPPDFSFATGSGTYINEAKYDRGGKGYGGDYKIFNNITKKKPDFMLWLGDNIYLRSGDWNTKTGIYHRYTHTRSIAEMQSLLASVHHYAIWDDHDFGDNDSDRSFWNKNETLEAFKLFWANPSYGIADIKGAITFFTWADCDFFMLDNRFYRTPNHRKTDNKTILGKEQLEWLKNALSHSKANFKFVVMGGQFLTTAGMFEVYSNYGFDKERNDIINFIHEEKIENIIFVTGDRHHSEINVLNRTFMPTIYDITVSPFTSGAADEWDIEINPLRVEGSLINVRNYAVLKVSGKYKERKLTVVFYDVDNNKIFEYEIKKQNLKKEEDEWRKKRKKEREKQEKKNKNKNKKK